MEISLKIAEDEDADRWNMIVESSIHGSIFHTWKWLKIAEKYSESKLIPVFGLKGSVIIGIYPLFFQKKFGIPSVYSPPAKTSIPYLGPVMVDFDKLKQSKKESILLGFQESVDDFIFTKLRCKYAMISSGPGIDPRPFLWTKYNISPQFDYQVDLKDGKEKLWQNIDKEARDHIKKIQKINNDSNQDVNVYFGNKDDIVYLYESLGKRYVDQKRSVNTSLSYLFDVFEAFYPQNIKIFIVEYKNKKINGVIALLYHHRISFWVGAAKPEIKEISSSELIHWEAIKWGCENNYQQFEEFGANLQRLARLKSKYNPDISTHFSAIKYSSPLIHLAEYLYFKWIRKFQGYIYATRNR